MKVRPGLTRFLPRDRKGAAIAALAPELSARHSESRGAGAEHCDVGPSE